MHQSISSLMSFQSEKRNKRVEKRFTDHKSKIQNFALSVNILGQSLMFTERFDSQPLFLFHSRRPFLRSARLRSQFRETEPFSASP